MGWRPSSWWVRSADPPAPPEPAVPAVTPDPPRAWQGLPALTPILATGVQRVALSLDFAAGLAAHHDPRFLQRLSHRIDPSIGGLVDGLAVTGVPHDHGAGPDLVVPAGRPASRAPRVQRHASWAGSTDLPTARWELPDAAPDQPGLQESSSEAPKSIAVPAPAVMQRAVSVEPPRPPRAQLPVVLQRDLAPLPAAVSPVDVVVTEPTSDRPDAPHGPRDHERLVQAEGPAVDLDSSPVSPGWTEVALPVAASERPDSTSPAPVQRKVQVGRAVSQPSSSARPAVSRTSIQPPSLEDRSMVPSLDAPSSGRVAEVFAPVREPLVSPTAFPMPESPAEHRSPSVSPIMVDRSVQRSAGVSGAPDATSAPHLLLQSQVQAQERPAAPALVAAGIPLVQRTAGPTAPGAPTTQSPEAVTTGVAMSLASMFAGSSPGPAGSSASAVGGAADARPGDRPVPVLSRDAVVAAVPLRASREVSAPTRSSSSLTTSSLPHPRSSNPNLPDPRSSNPNLPDPRSSNPSLPNLSVSAPSLASLSVQTAPISTYPGVSAPSIAAAPDLPDSGHPGSHPSAPRFSAPSSAPRLPVPTASGPSIPGASLQREPDDETSGSAPATDAEPESEPAVRTAADGGAPGTAGAAAPAAAPAGSGDVEELARRLYEPLVARLRAELWLDRERAGVFGS